MWAAPRRVLTASSIIIISLARIRRIIAGGTGMGNFGCTCYSSSMKSDRLGGCRAAEFPRRRLAPGRDVEGR